MGTPIGLSTIAQVREAGGLTRVANLFESGASEDTIFAAVSRMFAVPDLSRVYRLMDQGRALVESGQQATAAPTGSIQFVKNIPINPQLNPASDPGARFYYKVTAVNPNNLKQMTSLYITSGTVLSPDQIREEAINELVDRMEESPGRFKAWSSLDVRSEYVNIDWQQRAY